MKTYVLTVTADVAQRILNSLSERPFKEVSQVMQSIENQIIIQNKKEHNDTIEVKTE